MIFPREVEDSRQCGVTSSLFCSRCWQHASANSEINISFIVGTENFKLETINDHKCYKEVSCIVQVGSRENGCNEGTSKQNVLFRSAHTIKKEREAI